MVDDNPDNMTAAERLDWILSENSLGSDSALAALPHSDHDTIRQAVRRSIEASGIHATGEHWAAVLDTIGPAPKEWVDTVKIVFNQEVAECF